MATLEPSAHRTIPELPSEVYVKRAMSKPIGNFGMLATYVCALFLITNAVIGATGGPVSLVYLIIGAVTFFLPCIIATAQLGVMLPYEGGLYNWTHRALGPFWALFAGCLYWLAGVLAVLMGSDALVTTIQGLNMNWLTQPWQQGLVILGVMVLAAIICMQRFQVAQYLVNTIFILTMLSVFLIVLSLVVWLLSGHPSQTDFHDPVGWSMNWRNVSLLGIITLNFIGVNGPLNMAGEINGDLKKVKSTILKNMVLGSVIAFFCYLLVTTAVLVVRGPAILTAAVTPFEAFTLVYVVLGKFAGSITTLCFLSYAVLSGIFYSYSSSRIIMAAAIDQRLPAALGRLNINRVPATAIIVQLVLEVVLAAVVFILFPAMGLGGNAATAQLDSYNVLYATCTLVWTVATMFLFINLIALFGRRTSWALGYRIFPRVFIWLSIIIGILASVATIAGVVTYSWIPQLISNYFWWIWVGGLSLFCIVFVMIGSMVFAQEASYKIMQEGR